PGSRGRDPRRRRRDRRGDVRRRLGHAAVAVDIDEAAARSRRRDCPPARRRRRRGSRRPGRHRRAAAALGPPGRRPRPVPQHGRLAEAAATYAKIATTMPGPALDAREARLAWLTGDAGEAMRLATRARDAAAESTSSDPSFYEAQLGEMARLTGDAETARSAFDAALAIRPTNQLALLRSARLDAAAGNDAAAIAALQTAAAIAPWPEMRGLLAERLA